MTPDDKRSSQLALLMQVLSRPDLARGQRTVFIDMQVQMNRDGVILSDAQERWLQSVADRPLPDPDKSLAITPVAWHPPPLMTWGVLAIGAIVLLDFLFHLFGR